MHLETELREEFYPNGKLKYTETIAYLSSSSHAHLYSSSRTSPDGRQWIRIGRNAKWYDNGVLAWELIYDEMGNVIDYKYGYRKDGTPIMY